MKAQLKRNWDVAKTTTGKFLALTEHLYLKAREA